MSIGFPPGQTDANGFWTFGSGSNLRTGTNPSYDSSTFLAFFPQFGNDANNNPVVPTAVIDIFIAEAQQTIQQVRFRSTWPRAMALFIAHNCQMWLQTTGSTGTTADNVWQDGKFEGVVTNRSVEGLTEGYDTNLAGRDQPNLAGWGAYHLTEYGVQFATLAKRYGLGGMHIW